VTKMMDEYLRLLNYYEPLVQKGMSCDELLTELKSKNIPFSVSALLVRKFEDIDLEEARIRISSHQAWEDGKTQRDKAHNQGLDLLEQFCDGQ